MEEKKNLLTYEGLQKLENELHDLKVVKRKEVAEKLKEARAQGDLSENAEYDAARNEQAEVEAKIAEIERTLDNVEIIHDVNIDKVSIGTKVTIKYVEDKETEVYFIVGSKEADPFTNKISNESPIALAIIGKKEGEIAKVSSPNGEYEVKVLKIR